MSTRSGVHRFHRSGIVLALAALLTNLAGCVERRMTLRSNPPGALVYIDDYEIGTTPVSTDYIYYGTRKFRLVKEGYETLTVYQPMPSPWYEWLGIDFFSENVWPGKIRDERGYDFQMTPLVQVPAEQVLGRAEQLRAASRVMPAAAPPAQQPPVVVAPAQTTAPPPGMLAPPPVGLPSGSFVPPAGTVPNYGPPGGFVPGIPAPGAPSGTIPPINPQPLPPDWRLLSGQAPGIDVRR